MKIIKRYNRVLLRPVLYRSVTWGTIALAAVLCWNRFVNINGFLSVQRDAFLVAGVFFWVLAWFAYLKADGVRLPMTKPKTEKRKPKRYSYGDIIDFAGEHIVTFDELDDEEQDLCRLAADFILGSLFLLLSVGKI